MPQISKVEAVIFSDPYLPQLLVRIETEDGLIGWGESWWGISPALAQKKELPAPLEHLLHPIAEAVDKLFGPRLINEDADRIEYLWKDMYRFAYRYGFEGVISSAVSGIDLALWDLMGQRLNVPVVQLLGGQVRDCIRAYASLPPLRDTDLLRREIKRALDAGFKGIKLHEIDPQMARIAREASGPDTAIMFDVNGHFTPLQAIAVARKLMAYDLTWFEEPTWPMHDHRAMACVKEDTGIRVAAGENEFSLGGFDRLIKSASVDYLMPEVSKVGGLTMMRKIIALAELHNQTLSPHGYRIGPALYANLHWTLSTPHADWVEIPFLPEGMAFPSQIPLPRMEGGYIHLPQGVGLGIKEVHRGSCTT